MDKKELLFLGLLATSCQSEEPKILESIPTSNVEVTTPKEQLDQKNEPPKDVLCTIDLSNHFIPELMLLPRDIQLYFTSDRNLQNPFQRERFGIFSGFEHHKQPFEHYAKAIERRGDQQQPRIDPSITPFTTERTLKRISTLEQQIRDPAFPEKQKEKTRRELQTLQGQVQEVKDIQQILRWEDYYKGEITGVYDGKIGNAVLKYQKDHLQRLANPLVLINGKFYELKADGRINNPTRELINRSYDDHAFSGVRRVLEERIFHAQCGDRFPYVLESQKLANVVDSAVKELELDTIEGTRKF